MIEIDIEEEEKLLLSPHINSSFKSIKGLSPVKQYLPSILFAILLFAYASFWCIVSLYFLF